MANEFVGVKDSCLALGNVPGDALACALPVAPFFWVDKILCKQ
jgi:hypothetical protein